MATQAIELRLVAETYRAIDKDEVSWGHVKKSMFKFAEAGYFEIVFFEDFEINSILQNFVELQRLGYEVIISPSILSKIDSIKIKW